MPFVIHNSGIDGSGDGQDLVFRTRTVLVPTAGKRRESIRSCGRDAVISMPYQPLGSMQSVLGLGVTRQNSGDTADAPGKRLRHPGRDKKRYKGNQGSEEERDESGATQEQDEESSRRGQSHGPGRGQIRGKRRGDRGSANGGGEDTGKGKGSGSQISAAENEVRQQALLGARKNGHTSLGHGIWNIRQAQAKESRSSHSQGFKEILECLRDGDNRIRSVRAGGSYYQHAQRRDPVDAAVWASRIVEHKAKHAAARGDSDRTPGQLGQNHENAKEEDPMAAAAGGRSGRRTAAPSRLIKDATTAPTRPTRGAPTRTTMRGGRREQTKLAHHDGHAGHKGARHRQTRLEDRLKDAFQAISHTNLEEKDEDATGEVEAEQAISDELSSFKSSSKKPSIAGSGKGGVLRNVLRSMAEGNSAAERFAKEVQATATQLTEQERKAMPSYVRNFPRKTLPTARHEGLDKMRAVLAERDQQRVQAATTMEDREEEADNDLVLQEQRRVLSKIQAAAMQSVQIEQAILQRSTEFCAIKSALQDEMGLRIQSMDFERGNEYRRKFVALDIALNSQQYSNTLLNESDDSPAASKAQALGSLDLKKQLEGMRAMSLELRNIQRSYNISNSVWFQTLEKKCKEMTQPLTLPEQKLLAALRQLILEGWSLTEALFKQVLLRVLEPEEHKLPPVQRMISLVRDNVLKMDLEEYLSFLSEARLFVPKNLVTRVHAARKKRKDAAMDAGFRAAAIAMKWKRKSQVG